MSLLIEVAEKVIDVAYGMAQAVAVGEVIDETRKADEEDD